MVQREQAVHLTHECRRFLVSCQGEGHQGLIPLERVQHVQVGEVLLEGLVGALLGRKLKEIHNLECVRAVESAHTVVELGKASGYPPDSELGLSLGELNPCVVRPELRELDGDSVEVEGEGRGGCRGVQHCEGEINSS